MRRCGLVPGGIGKEITAAHAARVLEQVTPSGAVQRARWELADGLFEDLRRADDRVRVAFWRNPVAAALLARRPYASFLA